MAWFVAPFFIPVTAVTTIFLSSGLLVETHISTSGVDSLTDMIGSMKNSGTVACVCLCEMVQCVCNIKINAYNNIQFVLVNHCLSRDLLHEICGREGYICNTILIINITDSK